MRRVFLLFSLLFFTLSLFGNLKPADAEEAFKHVNSLDAKLEKWAKVKARKGTIAFRKKARETKKIMDEFVDYDFISHYLFGERWEKEPQEKQDLLFKKLQKLYTDFYLEKIVYNKSFERKFIEKGVEKKYMKGVPESVFMTYEIQVMFKNKPVIYEFIYHVHKVGGTYKIFDLEMDGVSLARNYKKEFKKIVDKEGFDGLIRRIDKKVEESKKKEKKSQKKNNKKK